MTVRYLLDTNIVSDLVRHPRGKVTAKVATVGENSVATSIIVAAELRYGAAKKGSRRLTERVNLVLEAFEVIPFESPADTTYGNIRAALQKTGTLIGPNDLLIAAQALSLGLTLVTDNTREFRRVAGLKLENWLR